MLLQPAWPAVASGRPTAPSALSPPSRSVVSSLGEMHPFGSQLLQAYHRSIGWDPDNDYSQLTKPTRALLDLSFVPGLHFSLGKLPALQFANSASLSVLSPPSSILLDRRTLSQTSPYPTLTGSVSYVASSTRSFQLIPTRLAALTTVVDRFAVPLPPSNKLVDHRLGTDTGL